MHFFIPLKKIPTTTAQQQRLTVWGGKPHTFKDTELRNVEELFMSNLAQHAPKKPLNGPIYLQTVWLFDTKSQKKMGQWKITKPDTDNLLKLFKDCMTKTGFWKDDAQVCDESTMKRWAHEISGIFVEVRSLAVHLQTKAAREAKL